MRLQTLNYTAFFQEEAKGGYTVTVPLLPGCITYGTSLEEAKKMVEEAITIYIESLAKHNEAIPTVFLKH